MSRDLNDLLPAVADVCRRHLQLAERAGMPVIVDQTFRTYDEQHEDWRKGRETPGEPCEHEGVKRPAGTCEIHPLGLTVTNADAGQSWHNFGRAYDVVFINEHPKPGESTVTWSGPWKGLGVLGEGLGLEWGGRWPRAKRDQPHFQFTNGLSLAEARAIFEKGGGEKV